MTRREPPLGQALGLALLAGALLVVALARSPWWALVPPVTLPYVPADLRVLVPVLLVAGVTAASRHLPWPAPGLLPAAAILAVAVVTRLPTSTVLAASALPGSRPGLAVDAAGLAASAGAVLVGLHLGLEAARGRVRGDLEDRGVPEAEARAVAEDGRRLARESLAAAGLVAAGLTATLVLAGGLLRGETLPLAEVVGALLVLGVAAVAADWRGLTPT